MQTNEMARKLSLAKALGEKRVVDFLLENYAFNDEVCTRLDELDKYYSTRSCAHINEALRSG